MAYKIKKVVEGEDQFFPWVLPCTDCADWVIRILKTQDEDEGVEINYEIIEEGAQP